MSLIHILDQLTVDEMANMIAMAGYQTAAMDSVGKVATLDFDGPAAINNNFTGEMCIRDRVDSNQNHYMDSIA